MNPSATQQHPARRMMHQMQARASRQLPTKCSSYNFFLSTYPSVAEDAVSISPSISGKTAAASPGRSSTRHLITGGTLVVLRRPIVTPTNRYSSVS